MQNADFQDHLLDSIQDGRLLLVETERLVHQLQFRNRERQRERGKDGWESPNAITLNRWVERFWSSLWPNIWPASELKRWRLLAGCVESFPPPEPLTKDVSLVLALDESFGECLRYGMDPGRGDPANRLVEWRRSVWRLFDAELGEQGLFHPASLAERLVSVLDAHPGLVREKVMICGFEFAGYWERRLLQTLSKRPDSVTVPLPVGDEPSEAMAFSDPEQEIAALIEELVSARTRCRLHDLALVLFDSHAYSPLITRYFENLFGPPVIGERAGYNLPPDSPLTGQPLFLAGLLPLDFSISGQERAFFLGLLRSPYYGLLAPHSRALCQWEWIWREKGIERGLERFMGVMDDSALEILPERGKPLAEGLMPFLDDAPRTASVWAALLERFWDGLGFPVLANERDQIAWGRLREILDRFGGEFGGFLLGRDEFVNWIRAAAEKAWVERTGYENAGIQILSGLEVRGLAFKKVVAPGLVAGVLPQPTRSLPFLSPSERKRVQGGSPESQFEFGKCLLGHLYAAAPEVVVSRPLMDRAGEPCRPSPFWPSAREEKRSPFVPWRHDFPVLQRAEWVVQGIKGMTARGAESSIGGVPRRAAPSRGGGDVCFGEGAAHAGGSMANDFYCISGLAAPVEVTVSELETILLCRSRFLFRNLFGLDLLPELVRGVDPSERGQAVHAMAALFGKMILREPDLVAESAEKLLDELRNAIREAIGDRASISWWGVEERRLSGSGGEAPGLLAKWLELERERFADGWRWLAVERSFAGLKIEGSTISLRGRLDRLDVHPDEGLICWDYKTGTIPGTGEVRDDLRFPQLPAYVRAVEEGLVPGVVKLVSSVDAGYIDLGSVGRLKHLAPFRTHEISGDFFQRWESEVARALNDIAGGRMVPRWLAVESGCKESCPFKCLCGRTMSAD